MVPFYGKFSASNLQHHITICFSPDLVVILYTPQYFEKFLVFLHTFFKNVKAVKEEHIKTSLIKILLMTVDYLNQEFRYMLSS